jgi:23S rRNA (uracil1939-C5)-methyltransferase
MSDIERLNIDSLAYGGRGVSRTGGKVCFVRGALPGEEVTARVTKNTASYSEAFVLDVLKSSPERTIPPCPYFGSCGGCQLQHLTYEKELFYKRKQVEELFTRIAGMDLGERLDEITASSEAYGYRSSVTLHKGEKGYGYYREASHDIVNIERCLVAVPSIGDDIRGLTEDGQGKEITLKSDHNGRVWSSCRAGERFFLDRYRGKDLYLSPKAFSQCNRQIAEEVAVTLESWILPESAKAAFFDIYCGAGFFSFTVAGDFAARVGADENRISIDCAKNTVKMRGLKDIKFYRQDVEKGFFDLFSREKKNRNIFLLDPPRRGLGKPFLERISKEPDVDLIYYISCDPACMARDAKLLTRGGRWKLRRIKPFDMFPRTSHIEVLGEFSRAG